MNASQTIKEIVEDGTSSMLSSGGRLSLSHKQKLFNMLSKMKEQGNKKDGHNTDESIQTWKNGVSTD